MILIVGASQGILLSLAIGKVSNFRDSARMQLSAIIALFSVGIIANIITHIYFDEHLIHKNFIAMFFLLFGPLLYLYVKSMTGQRTRKAFLHFIPYIFSFAGILVFSLFFHNNDEFIIHVMLSVLLTMQICYYSVVTIRSFMKYSKTIRENFSSVDKIDLSWLRFLIGCFFTAWGAIFVIEFVVKGEHRWDYFWLFLSAIIYLIGYIGLTRPSAFASNTNKSKRPFIEKQVVDDSNPGTIKTVIVPIENAKYRKTALSQGKIDILLRQLEKYMIDEKPFLDPDLLMPVLAAKIGMPTHHLSQIINDKFKMNFFEFINRRRIDFAKNTMMQTNDADINITRIAFDSGFNSISSFNTAFKKYTGMTPSEYRAHIVKN